MSLHTRTHMRARTLTHTHTHTRTHAHARTHAHTRTHARTHAHKHTGARTLSHAQSERKREGEEGAKYYNHLLSKLYIMLIEEPTANASEKTGNLVWRQYSRPVTGDRCMPLPPSYSLPLSPWCNDWRIPCQRRRGKTKKRRRRKRRSRRMRR